MFLRHTRENENGAVIGLFGFDTVLKPRISQISHGLSQIIRGSLQGSEQFDAAVEIQRPLSKVTRNTRRLTARAAEVRFGFGRLPSNFPLYSSLFTQLITAQKRMMQAATLFSEQITRRLAQINPGRLPGCQRATTINRCRCAEGEATRSRYVPGGNPASETRHHCRPPLLNRCVSET